MPSLRDYLPGVGTGPTTLDSVTPGLGLRDVGPAPMPQGPDLSSWNDQNEAASLTEVGKGFRSGRLGSDANYLASQEFSLRAAGKHAEADAIRDQIGIIQQRAGVFAPRVQKVEDAWANPSDAPAWLGGVVGQVGSSMIDSVGTGLAASKAAQLIGVLPHPVAKAIGRAGSWIGAGAAAVPNVLQARGETANQMVEDPALMKGHTADELNSAAWGSGLAQGAIDTVLPSMMINRLGGAGIAKGIHKLPVLPRVAADMVLEGGQEVVQEGMKKGTLGLLNPERDTSGDASDYLNSFASGLGMAPHSAATIAVDNGFRRLGVKGDGERGDDIDLSGKDITTQLAASAKSVKGMSVAEAEAYRTLLHGGDPAPDASEESGLTRRRDALLSELAKFPKDPKAAEYAAQLGEMNDPFALMDGMDAMDAAATHLAPRLGLTSEELAKKADAPKRKNSMQVEPNDFGKGQLDSADFAKRPASEQATVIEAQRQHKTQTARITSLLENTYTQQHADAGTTFNPSIKKLLGSYAPELAAIMSPGVAAAPTAGDLARAKRIGSSIGSALGAQANGALVAVAQRLGVKKSPVFDAMHDEAVKVAQHRESGDRAVHAQHTMERDAAALALLDAVPEFDAEMAKQGVDLRLEGNAHLREQLLKHMEDHADGEGTATQAQLERQFGKEGYAKMMEIVGGPIVPRHESVDYAEQKATQKKSSDDLATGDETTDFEKRGAEKGHAAVDPGSLVFGHSQTEPRTAADAFKPDAEGNYMKLIPADRTDFSGKRSLSVMMQNMVKSLRSQSKDYSYGRQKDGKVGTSAKELMDRQNMPEDRRVALMGAYLSQENKGEDHADFTMTAKALPILHSADRILSEAVQAKGKDLGSADANKQARAQLKRVALYVANPERFLETDMPAPQTQRHQQTLAIAKAIHKAHADVRAGMMGHESLAPLVQAFKAAHDGREPSTGELANHFFSSRFLIHAEKMSDRDYLKIDNDEFTKLHREGTKLLRTAEHQADESGGNLDEHKAGMNLIHFRSLAAVGQKKVAAKDKAIAIPAHKLVAWVRDMRNKHTGDVRTGDNVESYSDNEKADQYLDDLKEGINALMTQKLVRGTPWIVNAAGGKEHFIEGMPPSLSVGDGRTHADLRAEQAEKSAKQREQREAADTSLDLKPQATMQSSVLDEVTYEKAPVQNAATKARLARDAELGQDEADMQDADHVRESEEMASGSKRDKEERDHQWKMTQVVLAAADRGPDVLNKLTAFTKAKRVAEKLWRNYIGDAYADPEGKLFVNPNAKKQTPKELAEAHAKAVGAILAYAKATEPVAFEPGNFDVTRRGDHFIAPLAALLTPNHMAAVAEHYPNELKKIELLKAKVASTLAHMAYGQGKGNPTITAGQLKQAMDSLTGYADAPHDLKAAQALLARAKRDGDEVLASKAQAAITKAKSASPLAATGYKAALNAMAQPYWTVVKERGGAAQRVSDFANFVEPPTETRSPSPYQSLEAYDLHEHHNAMVAVYGAPTVGAKLQDLDVHADMNADGTVKASPLSATLTTPTKSASQATKVTVDATPKPRAIARRVKSDPNTTIGDLKTAQAARPVPAGDYSRTNVDLYSDVGADTAAAEQGVDNVAALAGAAAQSIRGQTTEAVAPKRELPKIFEAAAEKLRGGETIQQVNDALAAQMDGEKAARPAAPTSKTPVFDALPSHTPGQKTMTYAGIGSRKTTPAVLKQMAAAAKQLAAMGYTLMSGGALGADSAFEQGAEGKAQVFKASDATNQTRAIAKEIHPNPGALGIFPLNLMARNTNQVFGADLKTPVDFVLTWTPDGAESTAERSINTGGTGQAIDMASRKGIPVINMAKPDWQARVRAIVRAGEAAKAEAPKGDVVAQGKAVKPASPARAPVFPMNYRDGQVVHSTALRMRPEFAGKDTMDLILSGDRTATTGSLGRFNGAKKGDVVMASGNGKQALIRFTSDPYRVERGSNEAWSKLEGWAPEVMNEYLGQYQATYELVNKPSTTATTTLADAIAKRQDYLNNPPADYTSAKAEAIKAWAEKQLQRVNAEYAKVRGTDAHDRADELSDHRSRLQALAVKADDVLEGDASLKDFEGEVVKPVGLVAALKAAAYRSDEIDAWESKDKESLKRVAAEKVAYGKMFDETARIIGRMEAFGSVESTSLKESLAALEARDIDKDGDMMDNLISLYERAISYGKEFAAKQPSLFGTKYSMQTVDVASVAQDLESSQTLMKELGFKTAPAMFADVAQKLLTNPGQDLTAFVKDSAKALSHLLMAGESGQAIRDALHSDAWFAERAKIAARLAKGGMMRGDALVESYRMITEQALTGELAARTQAERSVLTKMLTALKDFVSAFKRVAGSEAFADVVRNNLNDLIKNGPPALKAGHKKVSFQEAVDGDPQSARVLAHMAQLKGVSITGSIVLAAAGSVYRDAKNMLHDLDFMVSGTKAAAEAHLRTAFPGAVQVYDFQTSNGKVDSFLVPPKGATIENIVRQYGEKGRVLSFSVMRDGKEIGRTWNDASGEHKSGDAGTFVDFFTGTKEGPQSVIPFTVGSAQHSIPAMGAGSIFDAKLSMGRDKDINDFRRFTPVAGDVIKNSTQAVDAKGTQAEPALSEAERKVAMAIFQTPKDRDIFQAKLHLKKVLGDKITALFEATFPDMAAGAGADWTHTLQTVRIATANPVSILQRAYHESMHGFFSNILEHSPDAKALMLRTFSTPAMVERMAAILSASPEAVAALRKDPEEAAAYGYQLWAANLLTVGKTPQTFFEKVQRFLSKVFGMVRDNDKALAIMTAFHDGKLTELSAAGVAIDKIMKSDQWRAAFLKKHDKAAQALHSELMAAINVGLTSESAAARVFAKMFYHHPAVGEGEDAAGLIDSRLIKHNQYQNLVWEALKPLRGDNEVRDMAELHEVLNGHATPTQPAVAEAAKAIRAAMVHFLAYAKDAGVDIGTRDGNKYFPRVVAIEYLVEHKQEFVDMLVSKYPSVLKAMVPSLSRANKGTTIEEAAAFIHQRYIDHGGVEESKLSVMREDGVLNPFFASQNERSLHWIKAEDIKPFLSKDLVSTMTRYFSQGVRSAEYVRRFGEDGQKLKDGMARLGDIKRIDPKTGDVENYDADGPVVSELKAEAAKQGLKDVAAEEWVNRRMEDLQRSFGAMEGSLGKDITAAARQLQGWAMVYQVLRTLPLSLFSAMLDPNGIRVAGGTNADMWEAYRRGMVGVFRNWKDMATGAPLGMRPAEAYEREAEAMGVIGSGMALEEMGAVHGSEYESGAARRINHKFFMWNGITAWDRQMRMVATGAAMRSIVNNEKNGVPAHSARWLKELGLTQGDGVINTDADGKLIWNRHALAALRAEKNGTTVDEEMKQATEDIGKITVAVNRWVSRAIMAPNAALRPSRASDPHYAMFFQLKSFTYAFQETTMRYAMEEAKKGNLDSGVQMLRGIPIMIAADMTKAVLTNGGSLPGYMASWTMADWVMHAAQRGGLAGTGQFGLDALHNPHGVFAGVLSTIGGPGVSQGIDAVAGAANGTLGSEIVKGIPLVNKIGGLASAAGGMVDFGE